MDGLEHVKALPVLVAGCGAIGSRHLSNLRALGCKRLAACDLEPRRLYANDGAAMYTAYDEALRRHRPAVVLVCTPPSLHVAQATAALRAGCDVFIEKPLSHDLEGVDELLDLAAHSGRIVQVGYNQRFDPALQRLRDMLLSDCIGVLRWARLEFGQYLPDWRPNRDYRSVYSSREALGGGIVLDASHELDAALWLCGPVKRLICTTGHISDLELDVEDYAGMLLELENGARVEIHVDCLQRSYCRHYRFFGERGSLVWDDAERQIRVHVANAEVQRIDCPLDANTTYLDEIADFLRRVADRQPPRVDLAAGREALVLARLALDSARQGRSVARA